MTSQPAFTRPSDVSTTCFATPPSPGWATIATFIVDPLDASARGIQMPALSYMTEDEARSIWLWLKAVATHPLAAYAPAPK